MNFHETVQLQALRLKQTNTNAMNEVGEALIAQAVAQNSDSLPLKNICAHISQQLFERVEQCCNTLDISKRRFVEMALIEALDKAEAIVAEVDPFPAEGG